MDPDEVVIRNVGSCFVADCPSKRISGAGLVNDLHFLAFPDKYKCPAVRHQWALFCARDDGTGALLDPGEQRICHKHFVETDLVKYSTNKRKDKRKPLTHWRLQSESICPSLFPPVKSHPSSSSKRGTSRASQALKPSPDSPIRSAVVARNVDDSEWTLSLPNETSTGNEFVLDTFEQLKEYLQGKHGCWRSQSEDRHGVQFLTVYDSYSRQPETVNHLQWDLRRIVFDDQLRCSVFVASIQCHILPFDAPEFPTSTVQLDQFLKEFEEAPLCETVLTRYPPEISCMVFRELRCSYCPACSRTLKIVERSTERNQNGIAPLAPRKGTNFKNMSIEELRERCRLMSQVNSSSKKQLNRVQVRVQRQEVKMEVYKKETEAFQKQLAGAPAVWTDGGWLDRLPEPLRGFLMEFERLFNSKSKKGRRYKRWFLEQCIELYWYVGGRGYRALVHTMLFPLPSIRTLRRELAQSFSSSVGLTEEYLLSSYIICPSPASVQSC